ncbi:SMP-30/gluconolactonase/LRE family protein [Microlunatus spumicola]|uniref:SMP-30/gluconolactonase/LRE family protein n=1 Tax=Microlunatus spumicola TaxID=81499 RepID=A0ABP6WJ93_9ACTN
MVDGFGLHGLVTEDAAPSKVADGCTWSEGPLWLPAEGVLRWSDIPNDRIMVFDPATGRTAVHRDGVEFTNGRVLLPDGGVVQCSHGRRALEVEVDGAVRTLVDAYAGHRLNSPNDVVVHSDGSVWFSDPPYGITVAEEGHLGVREYGDHFVFRLDPATGNLRVVVADVEEPNGLAFSPDETVLYVSDTSAARAPDGRGNHHVRAYDIDPAAPWTGAKNGRLFATVDAGVPDGFKVDERGNVWTSSAVGVLVFSPDGAHLGTVEIPEVVGNLCFGGVDGRDLYVAASTGIYRLRTEVRDAGATLRSRR